MKTSLEEAAHLLNLGHPVAVPTETVYGLAASLSHFEAIEEVFRLKGRPSDNPLIIHLASAEEIAKYALDLPPKFYDLAKAFWPGALTVVLPIREETIPSKARSGLLTGAFRVPSHPLARELLKMTGPLVMPSANLSGSPSATSAQHVENDFGADFPVLDGGICGKGVESTILYWDRRSWEVVRLGALAPEDFFAVLGYIPEVKGMTKGSQDAPLCPGQMYRHYSPKARLILLDKISDDASGPLVGFDDRQYPTSCRLYSLGSSRDASGAAHRLYAVLRNLDSEHVERALVDMEFPYAGLWLTLRERLQKAQR